MRACLGFLRRALYALPVQGFLVMRFLVMRFRGMCFLVKSSLVVSSLCVSALAFASEEPAHPTDDKVQSMSASFVGSFLSTDQILETFSDTLDRGAVQGGSGVSAETRWYAGGRFETRWWREGDGDDAPNKVNRVTGQWTAKNDQRCVVFDHAPDDPWQCAAVFQSDDGRLVSLNPDGSVHGVHQIAPLELSAEDPH